MRNNKHQEQKIKLKLEKNRRQLAKNKLRLERVNRKRRRRTRKPLTSKWTKRLWPNTAGTATPHGAVAGATTVAGHTETGATTVAPTETAHGVTAGTTGGEHDSCSGHFPVI